MFTQYDVKYEKTITFVNYSLRLWLFFAFCKMVDRGERKSEGREVICPETPFK